MDLSLAGKGVQLYGDIGVTFVSIPHSFHIRDSLDIACMRALFRWNYHAGLLCVPPTIAWTPISHDTNVSTL